MITILKEPQLFQTAYNEVVMVLDSDKKTEDKFQYIVELVIGGAVVSKLKIASNLDGYGVVHLGRHLEAHIKSNPESIIGLSTFNKIENTFVEYSVNLSEEYVTTQSFQSVGTTGNPTNKLSFNCNTALIYNQGDFITITNSSPSGYNGNCSITSATSPSPTSCTYVTTMDYLGTGFAFSGDIKLTSNATKIFTSAVVLSENKYVYNGVLNFDEYNSFDHTDYIPSSTTPCKLLNSLGSTTTSYLDDRFYANFYYPSSILVRSLKVVSDNGTFNINNVESATGNTKFLSVGIGASNLNNTTSTVTVVSGALPIVDADTDSYTVSLEDISGNRVSEIITVKVEDRCYNYNPHRIMYLDRSGTYQIVNFSQASSKATKVKKKDFQKNYGTYDSGTNSYGWKSYDRGNTRLDTTVNEEFTVNSNWIDEAKGNQVEALIASPETYLLGDGEAYSWINILSTQTFFSEGGTNVFQLNLDEGHGLETGDSIFISGSDYAGLNGAVIVQQVSTNSVSVNVPFNSTPTGSPVLRSLNFTEYGMRAINVQTRSIKVKTKKIDKVINYKLKYTYSSKNSVQRS